MSEVKSLAYLFKKTPPTDLIETLLKDLQLQKGACFQRSDLNKEIFETYLPIIEPFYIPCKAKLFLHDFTEGKSITVLRHLLRVTGFDLKSHERVISGKKQTQYQIISQSDLSGNICVAFI